MSPEPPWKRPPGGGRPEQPSQPEQPTQPEPPAQPAEQTAPRTAPPEAEPAPAPAPVPAAPAPPGVQLPPPGSPQAAAAPAPSGGGGGNGAVIIGGVVALVAAVAVVLVIVLGGGDEEPARPDPTPVAGETPAPATTASATATTEAASTPTPTMETSASISELIPQQAGPWRFVSKEEGEVLLEQEGAFEAYLVDYKGGPGGRLDLQVGVLESAQQANALLAERIKERRGFGDRISDPEPYVLDGQEVGQIAWDQSKRIGLAFFTDRNLYVTVLASSREGAEAFIADLPF